MIKIKQKRSLLLLSTFGLVVLIAILPSTLAFTGTVVPNSIVNTYAHQSGTLSDLQYEDDDLVTWTGAETWPLQFKILTKVYFPHTRMVGTGNELEIEFSFSGGARLDIKISYWDGSYDIYYECSTPMKTIIYDLVDYCSVHYVQFFNHEFWSPGVLRVDYIEANY